MQKVAYRQEFRGRSYKDQDLDGTDFSNADIRGTDFSGATLIGAKFSGVKAGLQFRWAISINLCCLIVAALSGVISSFAFVFVRLCLFPAGTFSIQGTCLSVVSLLYLIYFPLRVGRANTQLELIVGGLILISITVLIIAYPTMPNEFAAFIIFQIFVIIGILTAVTIGTLAWATSISTIRLFAILINFTGFLIGSLIGFFLGIDVVKTPQNILYLAQTINGILSLGLLFYSLCLGKIVLVGNGKYKLLRTVVMFVCSFKGTCFKNADLTDANFLNATLKHTDLRAKKLTRTSWRSVKNLNQALTIGTYLENPKIRELVTTGKSKDKEFEHLVLRGLNLQSVNLQGFSFMGSNLNEANLRNANLSHANLTQAQFYESYLTSAILTGAYIQDWGISPKTKLEGIECEYVYMHLPTKDDPDPCRKPDNKQKIFETGDFSAFIAPIIKTLDLYYSQNIDPSAITVNVKHLDLYHHQGLDPKAAATAFVELAQEHPDANLEVIAIEGRGEDRIRIQVNVSDKADRSELDKLYFSKYEQRQANPYPSLQSLLLSSTEKVSIVQKDAALAEMRKQIQRLEKLLETALKAKTFYIENARNVGDNDMSSDRSFSINTGYGSVDISGVVNLGEISGDVTNSIGGLPNSPNDKPGLKESLIELKDAIESDTALSPEDQAEALEQVKALAEAGKKPEDGVLKKTAKTAVKILKGTVNGLPDTAKLAEACSKLLPIIISLLALT